MAAGFFEIHKINWQTSIRRTHAPRGAGEAGEKIENCQAQEVSVYWLLKIKITG
jgi:hypothetical protein